MAGLTIHSEKLTPALAKELSALCPFGALEETAEGLAVGAGCKMCRLCVKKSSGVITEEETPKPQINKEEWVGVAVFADFAHGSCIRSRWSCWARRRNWLPLQGTRSMRCFWAAIRKKRSQNCCATGPTGYMYTITRRWLNSPLSRTRMLLPILLKT